MSEKVPMGSFREKGEPNEDARVCRNGATGTWEIFRSLHAPVFFMKSLPGQNMLHQRTKSIQHLFCSHAAATA